MKMQMKMKHKKLVACLIALMMLLASMSGLTVLSPKGMNLSHAAEEDFYIEDGVLYGYFGEDSDIVIPDSVTEIADEAFIEDMTIESVVIPETVTKIGDRSFYEAYFLEEVVFEGEMPELGEDTFYNYSCIYFTVQTEDDADVLRDALYSLYEGSDYEIEVVNEGPSVPVTPPSSTKTIADDWEFVEIANGYKVAKYKGEYSGSLSKENPIALEIPAEYEGKPVVAIGNSVDVFGTLRYESIFADKIPSGVSAITIPESVEVIEPEAFAGCVNLESIDLTNIVSLGSAAFRNCHGLAGEIVIPATLDLAWAEAEFPFTMCASIEGFIVDENHPELSSKEGVLFSKDGRVLIAYPLGNDRESYSIPEGTTEVKDYAFKQNQTVDMQGNGSALESISFPTTLVSVGLSAFQGLSIKELTIGAGIDFEDYALALNNDLVKVTFAEGVETIPESLLHGCENLIEVNLPSTLKTIEKGAFVRAKALTSIELPEGLLTIGENAFEGSNLTKIEIPGSVKEIGELAFYMSKELKEITFADGTEELEIGKYAFNNCQALEKVELPERVTVLEDGVFSMCLALTEISAPAVKELKNYVFSNTAFAEFDFGVSAPNVTKMGNGVFRKDISLIKVVLPENLSALGTCTFEECGLLEKVVIPESVTIDTVPTDTFWYCENLFEIDLPASIKSTEPCAFSGCGANNEEGVKINIAREQKDFKRSLFDCMPIKVGDDWDQYGTWNEDYTQFTFFEGKEETFLNQDHTEEQTNASFENMADNSYDAKVQTNSRETGSLDATCACDGGVSGTYTASNATFNYKQAASSGTVGSGSDDTSSKPEDSTTGGSTSSNKDDVESNSPVKNEAPKTGDISYVTLYVMLLVVSFVAIVTCKKYKVR